MLTAKDVTVQRGPNVVLDRVSLSVGPGAKLGIVGPNGVGKSTLLRVLAGQIPPDSGGIERSPKSLRVGYLTQEPDAEAGETVRTYLARRTGVEAAGAELDRLTEAMAEDPDVVDAYSDALDLFMALGGDDFDSRVGVVAAEVGFPAGRLDVAVESLSGGQAARVGLAAVILARFEVFLLDEPTNDLDFAGLAVLEGFLAGLQGAAVIVSHDRTFLDRSVQRILEIEEHHHTSSEYAGGWSEYVERRALARSHQSDTYESWSAERSRLKDRIRTQRSWSEAGLKKAAKKPKDNDKAQRGYATNRTEKQAAKVRQSEKALQRLGAVDKPWEGWDLHLDLATTSRSGDVVARLDKAVVERGSFTLGPIDVEVAWADRIAITGPNGGGKSTLLQALFQEIAVTAGQTWMGPGVKVGEIDQRRTAMSDAASLLRGFESQTGRLPEECRSILAKFGLGAEHILRPVGSLSPGERTRAALAALTAVGTNCLVLDEPTNHLDLPAIEQLEEALERFDGTLLVVTHDRWLLESLSVERIWLVEEGKLSEIGG